MMKLRSKKFFMMKSKNSSKGIISHNNGGNKVNGWSTEREKKNMSNEIKWEVRPSGMLVQRRENSTGDGEEIMMMITIKVSTLSRSYHLSIQPTSTFGELKKVICMNTGLHPREQRLLYRGKERENEEHLHMVGVGDKGKVVLLEDPAFKDMKLPTLIL